MEDYKKSFIHGIKIKEDINIFFSLYKIKFKKFVPKNKKKKK